MNIDTILLLETSVATIQQHLISRDNKGYLPEKLELLMTQEREQSIVTSKRLNVPCIIHEMGYDETDWIKVSSMLGKK